MNNSLHRTRAQKIALIALMTATIEGGKLALAYIPNVEIVTLLIGVFSFSFGLAGIAATYFFVAIECLIWGINTWVATYVIYWPSVAIVFAILGRYGVRNRLIATACAVTLTAFFGVLSSLIDTGLLTGFFKDFWKRFSIIYVRGIVFYVIQAVCNFALFLGIFRPAVDFIDRVCPNKFKIRKAGNRKLNENDLRPNQ